MSFRFNHTVRVKKPHCISAWSQYRLRLQWVQHVSCKYRLCACSPSSSSFRNISGGRLLAIATLSHGRGSGLMRSFVIYWLFRVALICNPGGIKLNKISHTTYNYKTSLSVKAIIIIIITWQATALITTKFLVLIQRATVEGGG